MDRQAPIFVAGADSLIGQAIVRRLRAEGCAHLVGLGGDAPDLADAEQVRRFFERARPATVFYAAGRSGGILANQRFPADLMLDNLLCSTHVLREAFRCGAEKLLYLASSCSYPRLAPQPLRVEALMTGPLEPTNEAYAVAKLAGLKLCEAYRQQHGASFISAIPANAFGLGDDFSLEDSHVIPALLRKMHEAKAANAPSVELWGTGTPRREFIFSEDLADACVFAMAHYEGSAPLNLGGGTDVSIRELALLVQEVVGYEGALRFDASKPDGMPLKALDGSALAALGWRARTDFRAALTQTYEWFLREEQGKAMTHA